MGSDLVHHLGHLGAYELPKEALKEAKTASLSLRSRPLSDQEDAWLFLRELWFSGKYLLDDRAFPYLAQWISQVRLSLSADAAEQERQQLFLFAQAAQSYQRDDSFSLPVFKWRAISCWRVLCLLFPESIQLLERIFSDPDSYRRDDIKSVLLLGSALATSDDEDMAAWARDFVRRAARPYLVGHRIVEYADYTLPRQSVFVLAEAEGGRYIDECLDFLNRHRNPADNWEARLQRDYYESTDGGARIAMEKKLQSGKYRDQNTMEITGYILNQLPPAER
jgi:hypothetical protein